MSGVLEQRQQGVDAERIGASVGEQAGEDLIDEPSTGGFKRRGG
jgi:hypothetical protein